MDEKDKKFKSFWLAAIIALTLFNLVFTLLQTNEVFQKNSILQSVPVFSLTLNITTTITTLLFLFAIYYCSYRKPGTKLLTFMLISYPAGVVITMIMAILGKMPIEFQSLSAVTITILQQAAALWIFTLNWKVRKINLKLRRASPQ